MLRVQYWIEFKFQDLHVFPKVYGDELVLAAPDICELFSVLLQLFR